jgi:hypothetical protein
MKFGLTSPMFSKSIMRSHTNILLEVVGCVFTEKTHDAQQDRKIDRHSRFFHKASRQQMIIPRLLQEDKRLTHNEQSYCDIIPTSR